MTNMGWVNSTIVSLTPMPNTPWLESPLAAKQLKETLRHPTFFQKFFMKDKGPQSGLDPLLFQNSLWRGNKWTERPLDTFLSLGLDRSLPLGLKAVKAPLRGSHTLKSHFKQHALKKEIHCHRSAQNDFSKARAIWMKTCL
jgi:hypothetical protein